MSLLQNTALRLFMPTSEAPLDSFPSYCPTADWRLSSINQRSNIGKRPWRNTSCPMGPPSCRHPSLQRPIRVGQRKAPQAPQRQDLLFDTKSNTCVGSQASVAGSGGSDKYGPGHVVRSFQAT
jgi:hypothetical protein